MRESRSSRSAAAIASGDGGQPGIRASTGSSDSTRADDLVVHAQHVAAERAVAERGHEPRLGHRGVGDEERLAHPGRHGTGDEQHVGVPGGRDDADPEALQVRVRARGEDQLVLAAVARAGVDVANGEAAAAIGSLERNGSAQAAEVSEEREHQRSAQA